MLLGTGPAHAKGNRYRRPIVKKIKTRRITLNRESLRRLTSGDLGIVRGGLSSWATGPGGGGTTPTDPITEFISAAYTNCPACPVTDVTKGCPK